MVINDNSFSAVSNIISLCLNLYVLMVLCKFIMSPECTKTNVYIKLEGRLIYVVLARKFIL